MTKLLFRLGYPNVSLYYLELEIEQQQLIGVTSEPLLSEIFSTPIDPDKRSSTILKNAGITHIDALSIFFCICLEPEKFRMKQEDRA